MHDHGLQHRPLSNDKLNHPMNEPQHILVLRDDHTHRGHVQNLVGMQGERRVHTKSRGQRKMPLYNVKYARRLVLIRAITSLHHQYLLLAQCHDTMLVCSMVSMATDSMATSLWQHYHGTYIPVIASQHSLSPPCY